MSWMAKLYETYEAGMKLDLPDSDQLMPISHTLQNAHIRITIDGLGNFKRAEVLEKTQIILPATEKSAGRSGSGAAPHPLADKIQYIAKDYIDFGGKKKSFFNEYLELQDNWCNSNHSHDKVKAVKKYIEQGNVVKDLIESNILFVDDGGSLRLSWPKSSIDESPKIFKVLPKEKGLLDQGNALVCWSVEIKDDPISDTWKDHSLQKSWVNYESEKNDQTGLCYITGKMEPLAVNHPAKLRHTGDKAKLVSSNDMSGYTFRGRFTDSKKTVEKQGVQSVGISFDVTQKAHNALRWLISRQGFRNGDQAIIAWAVSGKDIPQPMEDIWDSMPDEIQKASTPQPLEDSIDHTNNLGQQFSIALGKYMAGYRVKLQPADNIIIMGLDSATPGRMAVTYYQEFFPDDYIERISKWHEEFSWYQRHKIEEDIGKKKPMSKTVWPVCTPSPRAIWEAIYGSTINDSLKKNTIERILPCIVEARSFPRDLVLKAVQRASNRNAYKSDEQWLWEKHLGIACALYRGFCKRQPKKTKEYIVGLEKNNNSRDYLYGRLLAIAERIEDMSLYVAGEKRSTTAARLMQRFADRPASTWRNIELALQPYVQRLKNNRAGFLHNIQTLLDEVMDKFKEGEFIIDKPLSGEFLLAYHSQRLDLRNNKQSNESNESQIGGDE